MERMEGLYRPQWEHDACGIGAVIQVDGTKSHATVDKALKIVEKLEHRAGKDTKGETGDGVGIMVQIAHPFFTKAAAQQGIQLGEERDYGVGMFFFPQDNLLRSQARKMLEIIAAKEAEDTVYRLYYDFKSPLHRAVGHQVLAINRGEREEILKVSVEMDRETALIPIRRAVLRPGAPVMAFVRAAAEDAYPKPGQRPAGSPPRQLRRRPAAAGSLQRPGGPDGGVRRHLGHAGQRRHGRVRHGCVLYHPRRRCDPGRDGGGRV